MKNFPNNVCAPLRYSRIRRGNESRTFLQGIQPQRKDFLNACAQKKAARLPGKGRDKVFLMRRAAIFVIRWYQYLISPDHGVLQFAAGTHRCRFFPSCSAYAIDAIRQYGLMHGFMASAKRIGRCHPWSKGGYDPLQIKN